MYTLRMWVEHVEQCHKLFSPSSRRNTVESNMKESIIYIWLVKTLHNVLFSFALSLVLFLPSWLLLYIDFVRCFLFLSVANRRLRSGLNCAKHVHCRWPAALSSVSRGAVLLCLPPAPPLSVHVTHEFKSVRAHS